MGTTASLLASEQAVLPSAVIFEFVLSASTSTTSWQRVRYNVDLKGTVQYMTTSNLPVIGWREWIELPDLGIQTTKAKVDTGARSSSLHAYDLHPFERDDDTGVRFSICPIQRKNTRVVEAEAKVLEFRSVRSSSGKASMRPVIVTRICLLSVSWQVELTLANRDQMGFRMLLGREAFRRRFVVDAGTSYYGGKPKRTKKRKRS